jgi:hypothetical protein
MSTDYTDCELKFDTDSGGIFVVPGKAGTLYMGLGSDPAGSAEALGHRNFTFPFVGFVVFSPHGTGGPLTRRKDFVILTTY